MNARVFIPYIYIYTLSIMNSVKKWLEIISPNIYYILREVGNSSNKQYIESWNNEIYGKIDETKVSSKTVENIEQVAGVFIHLNIFAVTGFSL